jgi:hypothetical protein
MLDVSELNLFNTCSFLLQSVGVFAQIQTLVHHPSSSNLQMADQDQVLQVNLIPLRPIRYYFSSISILDFFFCLLLFLIGSSRRDFNSH